MSELSFKVIGLPDSASQPLPAEAMKAVQSATVFSGGKRHHELVAALLPADAEWIDITVPLEDTFREYRRKGGCIVVFASGDPLFYGIAATLQREFPGARIDVCPSFNSLQTLAHRLALPYGGMTCVSLTGRPWKNLGDALIRDLPLVGLLTDRNHTPAAIARRMLHYGYGNYRMAVGELLGNETSERVAWYSLEEAAETTFASPNCVILEQQAKRPRLFGLPEAMFTHLDGRTKMITKMPVRLLSLSMLDLGNRRSFWDVGFCTGSVSVEARLRFPHLAITAFEKRPEAETLLDENSRRFGAPDITGVIGDFMETDLSRFEAPDAVFIGGHGGRLGEMMKRIASVLLPGGVVVFNSVSPESQEAFREAAESVGLSIVEEHRMALDDNNPITVMKAL